MPGLAVNINHNKKAWMRADWTSGAAFWHAGSSYYSSDSNTSTPAGFKQYCVPVSLAPGWHGLELRYSKAPLDRTSVFRFFVVDAEQVRAPDRLNSQQLNLHLCCPILCSCYCWHSKKLAHWHSEKLT
jgi:hypothetical protein